MKVLGQKAPLPVNNRFCNCHGAQTTKTVVCFDRMTARTTRCDKHMHQTSKHVLRNHNLHQIEKEKQET